MHALSQDLSLADSVSLTFETQKNQEYLIGDARLDRSRVPMPGQAMGRDRQPHLADFVRGLNQEFAAR